MNMMTAEMWDRAETLSLDALVGMAMKIIETPRPTPPAWMIAPNFRAAEPVAVREPQTAYVAAAPADATAPYRSIREVPRFS